MSFVGMIFVTICFVCFIVGSCMLVVKVIEALRVWIPVSLIIIVGICRFVICIIGVIFIPLFIVIAIKYTIWDAFLWCILFPVGLSIIFWIVLALCLGLLNAEERRQAQEEERERLHREKQLQIEIQMEQKRIAQQEKEAEARRKIKQNEVKEREKIIQYISDTRGVVIDESRAENLRQIILKRKFFNTSISAQNIEWAIDKE